MIRKYDGAVRKLRYILPAAACLLAAIFYFAGKMPDEVEPAQGIPVELMENKGAASKITPIAKDADSQRIEIDIKGAVRKPGVYEMKQGDRVIDAVNRAGGFSKKAEEKGVNLSARVKDEMLLYIPAKGEERLPVGPDAGGQDGGGTTKVNINSAAEQELETLNGIGPSKAKAIMAYREENGPFKTIEDLLNVPGIGEKSLENMKEQIEVD
ncbi:competence protein ComEA [Bacillus sp. OV194]|nr:competence protein ComEA [Bacillus sp. OV194]